MTPTSQGIGFTNTTTTNTPNPQAASAYSNVLNTAQQVASTPYQQYTGQLVQGFSPAQLQAFQQVENMQGIANPYIAGATGATQAALAESNPANFNQSAVNQYYSPYQQNVINATEAQIQNMNAQQQSQLTGNAIAQGAMGGDRVAVAQAQLAGQQALANNQTIAGLENQGYSQALGEYNQQQAQNVGALQAGAYSLGQLGTEAQNAALQGSQALLGTGGLQQQLGQAQLSTAYQQFLNQQAFPYQQASWLSGIVNATGPNMGGTSNTTGIQSQQNQQAAPSTLGQVAGAGTTLAGLIPYSGWSSIGSGLSSGLGSLGSLAAFLPALADGGRVNRDTGGGLPISGAQLNQLAESRWLSPSSEASTDPSAPMAPHAFAEGGRVHKDDGGSLGSLSLLPGAGGALGGAGAMPYGGSSPVISSQLLSENHPGHWQPPQSHPMQPMQLPQAKPQQPLGGLGSLTNAQKTNLQGNFGALLNRITGQGNQIQLPGATPGAGFGAVSPQANAAPNGLGAVYATGGAVRPGFDDGGDVAPVQLPNVDVGAESAQPPKMDSLEALKAGIAQRETGGHDDPYSVIGPPSRTGDKPYGKYQVMGENIPVWTKEALGTAMTPEQFLADTDAQEKVATHKLGQYYANTGSPAEAAKMWLGGPNYNPNAKDALGTTPGQYAIDVLRNMGQGAPSNALAYTDMGAPGLGAVGNQPAAPAAERSPLDFSPEVRQGLVAAGLGMLASRSPWAGVAIGEGGLHGVQAYQQAINQAREQQLAGAQVQNLRSEVENRKFGQGISQQEVQLKARQLDQALQELRLRGQNIESEIAARKAGNIAPSFVPGVGPVIFDREHPEKGYQPIQAQPGQTNAAPAVAPAAAPPAAPMAPAGPPAPSPAPRGAEDAMSWKPITAPPQGFVPQNHMNIAMNPEALKVEAGLAANQLKESREKAANADTTLYRLDSMDHQFDNLPQTGTLAPGTGAVQRVAFAKGLNTILSGMGMKNYFDPNHVASAEDLQKETFRLGADLSRQIGGREPGFIVQQAVAANPGIENTPMGYHRIVAGLREAQNYEKDRSAFRDAYFSQFGHLNGADEKFRELNPESKYAERAVLSTIPPKMSNALRQHPEQKADFDKKFGKGSADIVLGAQ